ncbi:MAG: hypothetical protein QW291_09235 [Thermofilaceae archaeon]
MKILTLFLTKDKTTFIWENYKRVRNQKGVIQDIYVISAKPIGIENNIVVRVPQHFPVPIRIGLSIRYALKIIDVTNYTHIFKVDGDIKLPLDYLINLLEKNTLVAGIGAALLISTKFFLTKMLGKYPLSYCDDTYILSLGASVLGKYPPGYDGIGIIKTFPNPISKQIEFYYGIEYYKMGLSYKILLLRHLLFTLSNPFEGLKSIVYCSAGYISAIINREERYAWYKIFSKVATQAYSWKRYLAIRKKMLAHYKNLISRRFHPDIFKVKSNFSNFKIFKTDDKTS